MSDILRKQNRMMNGPAITAGQIPYRNVTVEDKLDELDNRASANTLGTAVDISAYTSTNQYTFPSDGYVLIRASGSGNYISSKINDTVILLARQGASDYQSIYVKKGMTYYTFGSSGTIEAYFYPLEGSALPSAESEGF